MKNALAYYILCRVWQHLIDNNQWDAAEIISKAKHEVITDGIDQQAFLVADAAFRWSQGFDYEFTFNSVLGGAA